MQVKQFVDGCEFCSANARKNLAISGDTSYENILAFKPWDYVLIDIIDFSDLADENEGLSYVLVIMDVFSKFVFSFAMLGNDYLEVTNNLFNICLKEGIPRVIHGCSSSSAIVRDVVEELSKLFKIDCIMQGASPKIDASLHQAERVKAIVGKTFTKLLWDRDNNLIHNRWIDTLPAATFGYNLTPHPIIILTPFKAFRGRDPNNMDQLKRSGGGGSGYSHDEIHNSFILDDGDSIDMGSGSMKAIDLGASSMMESSSISGGAHRTASNAPNDTVKEEINPLKRPSEFDSDNVEPIISSKKQKVVVAAAAEKSSKKDGRVSEYPFNLDQENFELVFSDLQKAQATINNKVCMTRL